MTLTIDRLREIAAGCEGVSPGPNSINHGSENHHHCRVFDESGKEVLRTLWDNGLNAHRNVGHFARLDPTTVKELVRLASIGLETERRSTETAGADEGWQPIETAPKDGTRILAIDRDNKPKIARWGVMYRVTQKSPPDYVERETSAPEGWVGLDPIGEPRGVTHWRPLPAPPQPAVQGRT